MPSTKTKRPTVVVSLCKFDTHGNDPVMRHLGEPASIKDFKPIGLGDYVPRGGTPLRDATADFIKHLDGLRAPDVVVVGLLMDESGSMGLNREAVVTSANEFVAGMSAVGKVDRDAAGTVLGVIVTDGQENSSRRTSQSDLAALVAEREADGFTFIFLGANIDAWGAGAAMGLSGSASGQYVNYVSTPAGTASAMGAVTHDSAAFLADNKTYAASRETTSKRSITEDGDEVLANLGTAQPVAWPAQASPFDTSDSLEKARKAMSGE